MGIAAGWRTPVPVGSGLKQDEREPMLWTSVLMLMVLWLSGRASGYTMGGFIHALLSSVIRVRRALAAGEILHR